MTSPSTPRTLFGHPVEGLVHLLIIYVVWGSTFLGIRVAVREGAGWDPWSMAGSRLVIAGILLLLWAKWRGHRILPRGREWLRLSLYAVFIWVVGHGAVVWAEEEVASGQAALIIGSSPIWGAAIAAAWDRRSPGWRLIGGLVLGFAGLVILIRPSQILAGEMSPRLLAAVLGTFSWTLGVVIQGRKSVDLTNLASSGWQQLIASVGFLILFLTLEGGRLPTPTTEAWIAWAYLLVFGSLVAFTSYVAMMKLLPTSLVLTHAYVNPVVAVVLGWLILSEEVTGWTVLGAALILLGVAGVFRARRRPPGQQPT